MAGQNDPWLLDEHSGLTEFLHQDPADPDKFAIQSIADVEPLIERNKALLNDGDGYSPSREWRRVASIPVAVINIWNKQYGCDVLAKQNADLFKRLLNDPENAFLRTAPGTI